jgi:hypothetical protein
MKVSQLGSGSHNSVLRQGRKGEGGKEEKRRKTVCKSSQVFSIALLISDKKEPENVINYEFQASHRTLLLLHHFLLLLFTRSMYGADVN